MQPKTLTVSVSANGSNGSVVASGDFNSTTKIGTYDKSTVVNLTASFSSLGYLFDGWSGDLNGTSLTPVITMSDHRSVTATFSQDTADTDEIFFENTDPHSTPQGQAWNIDLNATVSLDMLWVEPGTFTMGSPVLENGRDEGQEEQHDVSISKGFYLGKHEITQAQYEAIMTGNSEDRNATPSEFGGNPNRPVENVSWHDAIAFCQILTQKEKDAGRLPADWNYTLPTEAQWEYARRS